MLFILWLTLNFARITGDETGFIRLVLGLLFSGLILFRRKPLADPPAEGPGRTAPFLAFAGAALALLGIVFTLHQFQWLGLVLLLYGCLRWALPPHWGPDIARSLFVLYWMHPLPGQIFAHYVHFMQRISIKGTEILLQAFEVPVWAEGFLLHTRSQTLGVPESCSASLTAVTVLMCGLGVAILLRFRFRETAILLSTGLVQVVLLNVLRISGIALWADGHTQSWADTVLHDTLSIFLLGSIALIYVEAFSWNRRRLKERRLSEEVAKKRRAILARRLMVVVLIFAVLAGLILSRQNRSHRAEMISKVSDALRDRDPGRAETAAQTAVCLKPKDRWLRMKWITLLIDHGKPQIALAEFSALGECLGRQETLTKARALAAAKLPAEALSLLDNLPADMQSTPDVAILRAECAARLGQADETARCALIAARNEANVPRLRRLFPFLAAAKRWDVIGAIEKPEPDSNISAALIGIDALLRLGETERAAESLQHAVQQWPDDPRIIELLYQLARGERKRTWATTFAAAVTRRLPQCSADELASYLGYAFELRLCDLAWAVYLTLEKLDPNDPDLAMAAARYADRWFTRENRDETPWRPGTAGSAGVGATNILPEQSPIIAKFRETWGRIPLEDALRTPDATSLRPEFLEKCLEELKNREARGTLSQRMMLLYPSALEMAGRQDEAHARLDKIARGAPALRFPALLQNAELYAREKRWLDCYETLRLYFTEAPDHTIAAQLLMVNAALELDLNLHAMDLIVRMKRVRPWSPQASIALAAVWSALGNAEEALFALDCKDGWWAIPELPDLLYSSGRVKKAEEVAKTLNIPWQAPATPAAQPLDAPPAESVLTLTLPKPSDEEQERAATRRLKDLIAHSESPFLSRLAINELEWMNARTGAENMIPQWEATGRDAMEKGVALHRLAILMAQQGLSAQARAAAEKAAAYVPDSAGIWRLLIALTDGAPETVRQAYSHCPEDPNVWLAHLVTGVRSFPGTNTQAQAKWAEDEIRAAATARRYSCATLVRAGSFLLQEHLTAAATMTARIAAINARGFLPAHVLAIRCAATQKNATWALAEAKHGAEMAVNPEPFYRCVAAIKSALQQADIDMLEALEFLADHTQQKQRWTEQLGVAYFKRTEYPRALSVLRQAIVMNPRMAGVQTLQLAAESARYADDPDSALKVLRQSVVMHPDRADLLNNLIYTLAQIPSTVSEAKARLPDLLKLAGDSYATLDTAAFVCLKAGNPDEAKRYIEEALKRMNDKDYGATEVLLNAAEIFIACGDRTRAQAVLDQTGTSFPQPALTRRATELARQLAKKESPRRNP